MLGKLTNELRGRHGPTEKIAFFWLTLIIRLGNSVHMKKYKILHFIICFILASAISAFADITLKVYAKSETREFPEGYEIISTPSETASLIKTMASGSASIAGYADVNDKRYFISDWSYERYKSGQSYNWIRPKMAADQDPQKYAALTELMRQQQIEKKFNVTINNTTRVLKFGEKHSVLLSIENPLSEDGVAVVAVAGFYKGKLVPKVETANLQKLLDAGSVETTIDLICREDDAPVTIDKLSVQLVNSKTGVIIGEKNFDVFYSWSWKSARERLAE